MIEFWHPTGNADRTLAGCGRATPLSLLWELPLLRVTTLPLAAWDALLPDQATRLPHRTRPHIPLDRPVPHPTTLSKLVRRAGPGVIDQLNAALLGKLVGDKLLRGRKLRVDTTRSWRPDIDYPGWCPAAR